LHDFVKHCFDVQMCEYANVQIISFTVPRQTRLFKKGLNGFFYIDYHLHIPTSAYPHINHPHIRTSKQGRFPR